MKPYPQTPVKKIVPISLLAFALAGPAIAAETIETAPVTVTATRTEALLEDVPAVTEIVDREEIESVAKNTVADALKYSSGVYFYGDMMRATPSIRGFEGKHTLILKDGRRYAGPQGKFNDPSRFTTGSVERIEVVRGPQSTLYGSEAMGGVINIISRAPEKTSFEVDGRYGTYSHGDDYYSGTFTATFADTSRDDWLNRLGLVFSAQIMDQDKLTVEGNETMLPENESSSFDTTLHVRLTDILSAKVGGGYNDTEIKNQIEKSSRIGMPPRPVDYLTSSENDYESYDIFGSLHLDRETMSGMIRAYYSHYEKDYVTRYMEDVGSHSKGEILSGSTSVDEGERETTTLEAQFSNLFMTPIGDHLVTIGGETRKEEFESLRVNKDPCGTVHKEGFTGTLGCYDEDIYAFYLQDEWQLADSVLVVPGVRYDHYDNFSGEVSPKLGITWKTLDHLRLKANYGHSFRAPGVGELYRDFYGMGGRYHIVGNPDLDPETGDGYDAGIEGEIGRFSGRASYFFNKIDDLIETQFMGPEGSGYRYEYVNISEAEIQGFEINGAYSFSDDLLLSVNYQYLDAMDTSGGDEDGRLAGKPRHMGNMVMDYRYTPWGIRINVKAHYMADYGYEVGGHGSPEEFKNDNSFTMALRLDKQFGEHVTLYVGADDIFDEYRTYRGADEDNGAMEQPGSFYYAGLKFKF